MKEKIDKQIKDCINTIKVFLILGTAIFVISLYTWDTYLAVVAFSSYLLCVLSCIEIDILKILRGMISNEEDNESNR